MFDFLTSTNKPSYVLDWVICFRIFILKSDKTYIRRPPWSEQQQNWLIMLYPFNWNEEVSAPAFIQVSWRQMISKKIPFSALIDITIWSCGNFAFKLSEFRLNIFMAVNVSSFTNAGNSYGK